MSGIGNFAGGRLADHDRPIKLHVELEAELCCVRYRISDALLVCINMDRAYNSVIIHIASSVCNKTLKASSSKHNKNFAN